MHTTASSSCEGGAENSSYSVLYIRFRKSRGTHAPVCKNLWNQMPKPALLIGDLNDNNELGGGGGLVG